MTTTEHRKRDAIRRVHVTDGVLRVRAIKGHCYLYLRTTVGAEGHSRPTYEDRYLGRIELESLRDAASVLAYAKARKWLGVKSKLREPKHASAKPHPAPVIAPTTIASPTAAPSRPVRAKVVLDLFLRVENNNKFVRGKKRSIEQIEWMLERHYAMKRSKGRFDYEVTVEHDPSEPTSIEKSVDELFQWMSDIADSHHCFIEGDANERGTERWF